MSASNQLQPIRVLGISASPGIKPLSWEEVKSNEIEAEYVPLRLARQRVADLSKELQNMKEAHVVAIETIAKKYDAIISNNRDQWLGTVTKIKDRANTSIRDVKMELQAFQVRYNECVRIAGRRDEQLREEIDDYRRSASGSPNVQLIQDKFEKVKQLAELQDKFDNLVKANGDLLALRVELDAQIAALTEAAKTAAEASAAKEAELTMQLKQQLLMRAPSLAAPGAYGSFGDYSGTPSRARSPSLLARTPTLAATTAPPPPLLLDATQSPSGAAVLIRAPSLQLNSAVMTAEQEEQQQRNVDAAQAAADEAARAAEEAAAALAEARVQAATMEASLRAQLDERREEEDRLRKALAEQYWTERCRRQRHTRRASDQRR